MARKLTKYEQGYIACLASLVHGHGINTGEMEAYRTIGSPSPELCRKSGLAEYDIEAVKKLREYCD